MLVNLMYYNGASVFHTGSCFLSRWHMLLFWATGALVNVFFPVCHRRHHWECTEDLRIDRRSFQSCFCGLFFPLSIRIFVLEIMFFSWLFYPFSEWSTKFFFPQEKSSFASFLMLSPLVLIFFDNKLIGRKMYLLEKISVCHFQVSVAKQRYCKNN